MASSSSDSGGGAPQQPTDEGIDAQPRPDAGDIVLARDGASTFLYSRLTQEIVDFSARPDADGLRLARSPEGFAVVREPASGKLTLACEFMDLAPFVRETDGVIYFWSQNTGAVVTMNDYFTKGISARVGLELGATQTVSWLVVHVFRRPCYGCKIWWSMLDVHRAGNFKSGATKAWKWVQDCWLAWDKFRAALGLSKSHLRKSHDWNSKVQADDDVETFLRFPAATTCMLLALLARLGGCPPGRHGGMKDNEDRMAAQEMLKAFTQRLRGHRFNFRLFCTDEPEWDPPMAPFAVGPFAIVSLTSDCCLSLDSLRRSLLERYAEPWYTEAKEFFQHPAIMTEGTYQPHLLQVLSVMCADGLARSGAMILPSLFRQIVWALGEKLDALMANELTDELGNFMGNVGYVANEAARLQGVQETELDTDSHLTLRYLLAGQKVFANPLVNSLAMDASRVGHAKQLQAAYADSENMAMVPPPQARSGLVPHGSSVLSGGRLGDIVSGYAFLGART